MVSAWTSDLQYNPALDGLRALAVIAVVAFHTIFPVIKGGMIGVDVFFVLSGFLITMLLTSELRESDKVDLKRFYLRRMARLMPPLVLSAIGTYLGYMAFASEIDIATDVVLGLLYVSDYGISFWGIPEHIRHTWSLSVEEHFYLVWPVFLLLTRTMKAESLFKLLIAMFIAATLWRFADALVWKDWIRTYYRFDTRLSGMILGSALAMRSWTVSAPVARAIGAIALTALAMMALGLRWLYMPSLLWGVLAADLATAALIVSLTSGHRTPIFNALSHAWLVRLGVLSYSIYLWHYGIAYLLRDAIHPWAAFTVTMVASVLISSASYRYVEAPLRKWSKGTPTARTLTTEATA